ncbi:MAG: ArsI/CadI family heavy metal resistance metalloenzyme [Betaproteobacteria bacterium]
MKRFHVHVSVPDLDASIRFYTTLFGTEPAVVKGDYAKWMLEDPRVNFAISQRGGKAGLNHLGLQTDSDEELEVLNEQLQQADLSTLAEKETACCYARSNKYWVTDPTGIAWETFHTLGEVPTFNGEEEAAPVRAVAACCTPEAPSARLGSKIPVKAAVGCCN